ncbi:hypothetical protein [Sphingomonas montana]|uniref:hypothetical protein n=1 Tax=Sphingomonas montana TaxID=1843236 RepID=UPI00096CE91E|nr:hypothetical protein [Sphingomonas montana]
MLGAALGMMAGMAAVAMVVPTPPARPVAEAEIVVIARKLRTVGIDYAVRGRSLQRCDITLSSGDVRLDRIMCCDAERLWGDRARFAVAGQILREPAS